MYFLSFSEFFNWCIPPLPVDGPVLSSGSGDLPPSRCARRGNPLTVCRRTPPRQHVPPWLPETACSRQWQVRWPRADLVPERCLDDGNHARAAGNKVRDRGSRLWRPRGLLRLHHPPTPSKLSMGELLLLLLLLLSSSHQRSENACGLFSSCKTRKSIGFWESNLFIIHHRRSLIYRDAAVLMSSLPPQTITRRRCEKSSKLQNSDNAPTIWGNLQKANIAGANIFKG